MLVSEGVHSNRGTGRMAAFDANVKAASEERNDELCLTFSCFLSIPVLLMSIAWSCGVG